jgi:ABC-2 type transport system ATP-binding protein
VSAALRFTEVHKRFGRTEALRGLDLEVPKGALYGLIGPNGAGKTTAFSIACGFLGPDRGEIGGDPVPEEHLGRRGRPPNVISRLALEGWLDGQLGGRDRLFHRSQVHGSDRTCHRD